MNLRINSPYRRLKNVNSACLVSLLVFLLSSPDLATAEKANLTILPTQPSTISGVLSSMNQTPEDQFGITHYSLSDTIIDKVEQIPAFPGGEQGMNNHVKKKFKKLPKVKESGLVVVQFVIDKQGKVGNIQVVKSLSPAADAVAIRIVEDMPDFSPALRNGQPVAFRYTLPLRFGPSNR